MKTERFTVLRDGLKIHGIAYLSSENDAKKAPALILSHGFLCNYTCFEFFGEKFCEYGMNVFCYNFCGGSSKDEFEYKSDGDSRDMCISSEIADLTAVFEYVQGLPYVDSSSIYLMGESQGAFVSGLTAAKLQEKIKKLIMIYPAVCIPDHARRGVLGGGNYDPKNPPQEIELPATTLGKGFHDDVVEWDAYSKLAEYKGPVLLIQGTDDDIVVPQYQYIVKDSFDKTDKNVTHRCKLQIIRGMGHATLSPYRETIVDSVRQFIEDKEEILTFRIIVTKVETVENPQVPDKFSDRTEKLHFQDVYFTGYSECDLFTGTVTEGVDHQIYDGDECLQMLAEYTFVGVDSDGQTCRLDVVNKKGGIDWKPVIKTDSEKLKWLESTDLTAVVEAGALGPTIRIYK